LTRGFTPSRKLVEAAPLIGSGIGGTSVSLEIEGWPVFAKRVPLTDLERRPDNVMSTANVFQLPTCYQYGVGSAGFGAWRELAAYVMTTNWVLGGRYAGFPLRYAPVAVVMNDFYWKLFGESRATPYPVDEIERACAAAGLDRWIGDDSVRDW
jgi:hypothetical protein